MKIIRETIESDSGTLSRIFYEDASGRHPLEALPDGAMLMSEGEFNSPSAYAAWREVYWLD